MGVPQRVLVPVRVPVLGLVLVLVRHRVRR